MALWTCFMASKNWSNNFDEMEIESNNKSNSSKLTLYNPTPIHPKANQIISFPTTMATVIIHFPEEQNLNDLMNNIDNNRKSYMV